MQIRPALQLPTTAMQDRPSESPVPANAATERDKVARRKLEQARDALAKVTALRDRQKDLPKAIARKKVQDLRDRLKAIRFMFANDPKAMARAVAEIARELGAAVKNYLAAGGSLSDLGGAGGQPPAGGAATNDDHAPVGSNGTDTATAAEAPSERNPATDTSDKSERHQPAGRKGEAEANAYRERLEQQRADPRVQGEQADAEFARDARDLAGQLKALIRALRNKQVDAEDIEAADGRLDGVEQDLAASSVSVSASAVSGLFLSLSA